MSLSKLKGLGLERVVADSFAQLVLLVQALIVVMGWTGSDVDDVVWLGGSEGQLPQQLKRLFEEITHTV